MMKTAPCQCRGKLTALTGLSGWQLSTPVWSQEAHLSMGLPSACSLGLYLLFLGLQPESSRKSQVSGCVSFLKCDQPLKVLLLDADWVVGGGRLSTRPRAPAPGNRPPPGVLWSKAGPSSLLPPSFHTADT